MPHVLNQIVAISFKILCISLYYNLLCRPFPKEVHHEYYQDLDLLIGDADEDETQPNYDAENIYANLNELAM